jgi:hypothetical protein
MLHLNHCYLKPVVNMPIRPPLLAMYNIRLKPRLDAKWVEGATFKRLGPVSFWAQ